jgi:23S rRNA pseudouridine2457 synthase
MSSAQAANPLLLFNKPFGVLCQFTDEHGRLNLSDFITAPGYYAAGRLDKDSEGLLLLTDNGQLQKRIADPSFKLPKTYLVQVEGVIDNPAISKLNQGIELKDGPARAYQAQKTDAPASLWPRDPPIRFRQNIPTSWVLMSLQEGKNRQVRRMTAAVGFPTLRLIRTRIGPFEVWPLTPGKWRYLPHAEYADKL